MDIYPIALSFYAILFIAAILSLKSTIKAIERQQRNFAKQKNNNKGKENKQENGNKEKSQTCRIYKYLIKAFTAASLWGERVQGSTLLILFTYCMVGLYLYFTTFWQIGISFGSIISLTSLLIQILQRKHIDNNNSENDQQINEKAWRAKKILYVLIGITTISIYLAMIGICYKNYINSRLRPMMVNFIIVFSIDNFALKPFILLAVALIMQENQQMLDIVGEQERKSEVNLVRVANDFEKPETKQQFIFNLQVQPQPIDLTRSKEFTHRNRQLSKSNRSKQLSKSNRSRQFNQSRVLHINALQALPSSSIIDNEGNNEGSLAQMICHIEGNKSGMHKMTSMKDLNELQLQKIQENPRAQLQNYFCINLRRSRETQQSKQMENKLQTILKNKPNIQTSQFVKQFILQDFVCCSPKIEHLKPQSKDEKQEIKSRYSKSKGSLKGAKTFRVIQRDNINIEDKENTVEQSTKNQISEMEAQGTPKNRFPSRGRKSNKTHHILKISEKQQGELEQIDVNSPNKRVMKKPQYSTHVIPEEEVKIKRRNRRRTAKEVSQPYILQDKLIEVYFPGKNKSDLENYIRSKKKNFDRSQFFNNSNKKEYSKGREKPIVHQSQQHHTQFFIPKF